MTSSDERMQPVAPTTFSTLDDALAEIRRLRDQVNDLQREITRLTARTADDAGPAESSPREKDAGPAGAAGPRYVATAPAASGPATTPDNAAVVGQLEHLREAIERLREQRARASEEFRNLTRAAQRDERAPAAQLAPRPSAPVPLPAVAPSAAALFPSTPALSDASDATEPAPPAMATDRTETAGSTRPTPHPDVAVVPNATAPAAGTDTPRAEVAPPQDQPVKDGTGAGGSALPGAASHQGFDAAPPVGAVDNERRAGAASLVPDLTFSGEPPRASTRRRWLVAAVVLAAAAMAAWFLVDRTLRRSHGVGADRPAGQAGERQPAAAAAKEGPAAAPPPGATAAADTPGATAPKPSGEAGKASRPAAHTAALRIRLEATREVWLRAVADGRQITARLFKPGEVLELEAESGALVRAGDAGAVRLIVNGVDRGPVGRDGAVLTRVFDAATENRKPRR